MALQNVYLAIEQDTDQSYGPFGFWAPDPSGLGKPTAAVPYNFTGATAKLQVKLTSDPLSTTLLTLTSGGGGITFSSVALYAGDGTTIVVPTPAFNNAIGWAITNAQSVLMAAGDWYFELVIIDASSNRLIYEKGPFQVVQSGVR